MKRKKRNISKSQNIKSNVRKTKEWRQLRIDLAEKWNNCDALTQKRLRIGWNCHHMDMRVDNYGDLRIERFLPLNRSSHDLVHVLYRYYVKDPAILKRLKDILDEMVKMNDNDN